MGLATVTKAYAEVSDANPVQKIRNESLDDDEPILSDRAVIFSDHRKGLLLMSLSKLTARNVQGI